MEFLRYFPDADYETIKKIYDERNTWHERDSVVEFRDAIKSVNDIKTSILDFSSETVRIGESSEINEEQSARLYTALKKMMPWRKGPFNIFGIDIDAEWQSNRKWDRLLPEMPDLKDKLICDIGCNNGYYMFRMMEHKPAFILGIDPMIKYYYSFELLKSLTNINNIDMQLFGVEHLHYFKNSFNVIFLMGIIYHHRSPFELLQKVRESLKKGGTLVIETQGIPGDDPVALFPEGRYAKVPGTYFIPTVKCLENFLKRAGFKDVKTFCTHKMSSVEQRVTDWMIYESYSDFISKDNPDLTVEGYPAPIRIYTRCEK